MFTYTQSGRVIALNEVNDTLKTKYEKNHNFHIINNIMYYLRDPSSLQKNK